MIDKQAIERDFCAGVLSLQTVADKYGITIKAPRYMAGKKGWIRAKTGQKKAAKF
ncbi:hypothetical protein M5J15_02250 [Serratia symbiotica]|uniref:hypothetical protein n=1 Tax=Serratia symbiotica TaxID=138074 RepID=UPI001DCF2726|nr:hypothetical protein [Serratia symbiotica]NIG87497.1 hypothetical protein [Serratia symbiotica]USS96022.1 hypothetical protein M5J15_02250 [Serratia symbiotica]